MTYKLDVENMKFTINKETALQIFGTLAVFDYEYMYGTDNYDLILLVDIAWNFYNKIKDNKIQDSEF